MLFAVRATTIWSRGQGLVGRGWEASDHDESRTRFDPIRGQARKKPVLPVTGHAEADQLLVDDPLARMIGMLLDQQVPMEWAFGSPLKLKERLGGALDAGTIASMPLGSRAARSCNWLRHQLNMQEEGGSA